MKVLQINAVYGYGSTGTIVKDINDILKKRGHKSYVVYARGKQATDNAYKIGNFIDYKIHGLLTRIMCKQAYFSLLSTSKLLKYIDKISPDIIHLHNLHSNYINLNLLLNYIKRKGIKTVITLHDCWFFTGKCFHYVVAGCNKWQTQCNDCPKLKQDVSSWLLDKTATVYEDKKQNLGKITDLVIVGVSQWISNEAKKSFFKEKNIVTIQNGVDLNIFKPTNSDIRVRHGLINKFVILGTANKWLDPLNIETFEFVIANLSEDETLILLGCNEKQMKRLPDKVIGLKYISDKTNLSKIYSMSDVFVNVTWEDSLPTVNIESICCGTPVITFNSGGSAEVIDESTGIVVEQGDYISLLDAIREVKTKGKVYYQLKCIERGIKKFNKNDRYKEYIRLYEKIMENGESRR